jgi:DBC1
VELYYRRSESHKGRLTPARIETVVIFLPDIRTCQPTRVEWDKITSMYKNKLDSVIKNCNQNQKLDENNGGSAVAAAVPVVTPNSTSSTTKNAEKDGAVVAEPSVADDAVAVAAAPAGAEAGATDSAMEIDGAKVEIKLKDSDESQLNDGAAGNEKAQTSLNYSF